MDVGVTEPRAVASGPSFDDWAGARVTALLRFAYLVTGSQHAAEDAVQSALERACRKWARVSRADDPDAYVRRMVVNASTSFWRRAVRRERPVEHERMPDVGAGDPAPGTADRDQLLALLRRLPTKQRAVLVLRHYEGLADAEIADLLEVSPVTVRSNAHRGLASLRAMLEAEGGER